MKKISIFLLTVTVLGFSACITTPKMRLSSWDLDAYLQEVKLLVEDEHYEKGKERLVEALQKFTGKEDTLYLQVELTSILVMVKEYSTAINYIKSIMKTLEEGILSDDFEIERLYVQLNSRMSQIFEKYLIDAQYETNNDRYSKAIDMLNEAVREFPDTDNMVAINYNIGFNYYKLKKFDDARKYFELVINKFEEGEYSVAQKKELRKFVILSTTLINKMQKDIEAMKDPYRIKEDLKKVKKIRPKS